MENKSDIRIRNNRLRRKLELRNHIILFLCTIFFISILTITFGSFLSKAKDVNSEIPTYKYFKSIIVQPGDSLFSIALDNVNTVQNINAYINEVIHINSLEDSNIHAGQYVIIPYYSPEFK